jgi:AAA domain
LTQTIATEFGIDPTELEAIRATVKDVPPKHSKLNPEPPEEQEAIERMSYYAGCNQDTEDENIRPAPSAEYVPVQSFPQRSNGKAHKVPDIYYAIPASELAEAKYDIKFLIDNVLVDNQPAVIGGPKKALKTTLALDLGISLATGTDFLGRFAVNQQKRVLVCSAESGLGTIQETVLRICKAKGVELASIDDLFFETRVPSIQSSDARVDFAHFLKDTEADIVICDAFYRMHDGKDASNLFAMGAPLAAFGDLCQSVGATPIVCHHSKTSRLNQYAPLDLDDLAFAGCAEYFRQWLLLSRREAYEPGSGLHSLWLTLGGSAGHNGLWGVDVSEGHRDDQGGRKYLVTSATADNVRQRTQQQKESAKDKARLGVLVEKQAKVVEALTKHPDGLTKSGIQTATGLNYTDLGALVDGMLERGELVETQVFVSNHKTPKAGFKLAAGEVI